MGGHFVCKFYQGAEDKALEKSLKGLFHKVHREKPESSRSVCLTSFNFQDEVVDSCTRSRKKRTLWASKDLQRLTRRPCLMEDETGQSHFSLSHQSTLRLSRLPCLRETDNLG